MDPVQIIITIAACLAGLVVLYFILAVTVFAVMAKKAKRTFDEFDKGPGLRRGATLVTNRTGRSESVFGRNQRGPRL